MTVPCAFDQMLCHQALFLVGFPVLRTNKGNFVTSGLTLILSKAEVLYSLQHYDHCLSQLLVGCALQQQHLPSCQAAKFKLELRYRRVISDGSVCNAPQGVDFLQTYIFNGFHELVKRFAKKRE